MWTADSGLAKTLNQWTMRLLLTVAEKPRGELPKRAVTVLIEDPFNKVAPLTTFQGRSINQITNFSNRIQGVNGDPQGVFGIHGEILRVHHGRVDISRHVFKESCSVGHVEYNITLKEHVFKACHTSSVHIKL